MLTDISQGDNCTASVVTLPGGSSSRSRVTVDYGYDALNRLTAADYDDGTYYHYVYDPVGNRLSQTTQDGTVNYQYDQSNRLTSVDGQTYTWDANGNLLSDGATAYAYDSANRLTSVSRDGLSIAYAYSGLGDRMQQTVNGVSTQYTLDISPAGTLGSGLTQVLQENGNTYLYGNGRIAQVAETQAGYFLPDALGSVRQVADGEGALQLARSYDPYGNVIRESGEGESLYGYTGEQQENGLVYLRARYYAPVVGRFLARDTWNGNENRPESYNKWLYVYANPIIYKDPSGLDVGCNVDDPRDPRCHKLPIAVPTCEPTPILNDLGVWKITHYNYALESDSQFPSDDKVPVSGLDQSKMYRRQFIYSKPGIYGQGTGKSESGEYITIDHSKNLELYGPNWIDEKNPAEWYFKYGKGGSFKESTPWASVAISINETNLKYNDKVQIDGYRGIFEVTDTGTFRDTSHLDVFIGEDTHANALMYGTKFLRVRKIRLK